MNLPLYVALPGNDDMTQTLARLSNGQTARLECRDFPDGESYLRFGQDVRDRNIVLVCTLDHPNPKAMPLLFAARTARELGAARVGLVAPYLCYMRQDRRFRDGEAVTSRHFATLLSGAFDWLVTVDPHLHRYKALDEIYTIPARAARAGPLLARWIAAHVTQPFLIGPDVESAQWVEATARDCGAPFTVLRKERLGDRDVRIVAEFAPSYPGRTPVLVDDIISSGRTTLAVLDAVAPRFTHPPVVVATHGVMDQDAARAIANAGATLVTTNSVPGRHGVIDVAPLLASAVADLSG